MCMMLDFAGIDGQEDMKPIYGIIAAERKDKRGKDGKVRRTNRISIPYFIKFSSSFLFFVSNGYLCSCENILMAIFMDGCFWVWLALLFHALLLLNSISW